MSTRYADYDPFARMYNLHWSEQSDRHLELLESHVLSRLPPAANVLDLCCGTGQLAQVLTEKGHAVLGIDGSEHMLSFARTNAPTAQGRIPEKEPTSSGFGEVRAIACA